MFHAINYFSKKECKKIISLHKTYKNYGFNFDWYRQTYDKNNRRDDMSKLQAYLIPNVPYTKWMYDKLQSFFEQSTGIKFISPLHHCQLYKYQTGDVFPKHVDLNAEFSDRRWNLGINLNDDYEGGEYLCWDNLNEDDTMKIIPKSAGTICLYHSRQLHEIKEITKGERWSLVVKIESQHIDEKINLI